MGGDIMKYNPLGIKTEYTLLSSLIKIKDLIEFAKINNITALGLLDDNLNGVMEFYDNCLLNNIKPLIGLKVTLDNKDFYLYAKDYDGYLELVKINNKIVLGEVLDYNILASKNVYVVIPYSFKETLEEVKRFKDEEDIYFSYTSLEEKNSLRILSDNLLFLKEIRVLRKEDTVYLEYLKKIGDTSFDEGNCCYEDILESDDILRIKRFIDKIDIRIDKSKRYIPIFDESKDSKSYLYSLAFLGLKKRLNNVIEERYVKRLQYELDVIDKMGFNDYFLIVYDYVKYAKKNDILVGPGRGSAAGALVSYCLGITNVDPLEYNLLFERFLNKDRVTMPDIDMDFEDIRREDMIKYVRSRYGTFNVAPITTYGTLQARQVLRDVSGLVIVDGKLIDEFISNIDSKMSLKDNLSKAIVSKMLKENGVLKKIYKIAMKLEGLKRHMSVHAAGVVISSVSLDKVMPVVKTSEGINTGLTMNYLEELGFLKMDFLALSNLHFIHDILRELPSDFNLNNIPLDDKDTYDLFSLADTDGVFQFESSGMKNFLLKLKPRCFEDLYAAVALFRPGPMDNIDLFIERKNGGQVTYIVPALEPILKETYGIIVYQEQIMQILVTMAGFSMAEADNIRRAMSKKKKEILIKAQSDFIKRSMDNGYQKSEAKAVYDLILKFANYGFNKAHSVCYALIGYQMAYLKVHFKEIFLAGLLNMSVSNSKKTEEYLNLAKRMHITVLLPNINISTDKYLHKNNYLLLPLNTIRNVGSNTIKVILEDRKIQGIYKDYFDLVVRFFRLGIKRNVIESLIDGKALDLFKLSHRTMLEGLDEALRYAFVVKDLDESLIERPILKEYADDMKSLMDREYAVYGFYVSNHPASKYNNKEIVKIKRIREYLGKSINMVLLVNEIKKIKTKSNQDMAFLLGSDETGKIDLVLFPKNINYLNNFKVGDLVYVLGTVARRLDKYQININRIRVLDDE